MMAALPQDYPLEDVEIELLLEGVFRRYGYDFRNYALSSLRRRIRERVRAEGLGTVSALHARVLHDPECLERLVHSLSINVSAMFRDPQLYVALRQRVVPLLRTYPFIRVWHAGCSTGEEVYSMAILMTEAGLYDRCRFYATDMNQTVLQKARDGIFPLRLMKQYTANYLKAGGAVDFSAYYTAQYDNAIFRPALRQNVVFAQHNLVTDGPFNEFHLIMCRNVLIYFNGTLQARVHGLFLQSLVRLGFLCLGAKEALRYSGFESHYEEFEAGQKIYRRVA